jgi:hypothetical protein
MSINFGNFETGMPLGTPYSKEEAYRIAMGKPMPVSTSDDTADTGDSKKSDTKPDNGGVEEDSNAYAKSVRAYEERMRQINAIATLRQQMDDYGLSSLMDKITQYVQEGYDANAVVALIRTTPEYKERFPAMDALAKKNRNISEAAYIQYETNAASLEKMYGLPSGMLSNKNEITGLLTNEVSATELEQRVVLASNNAYSTSPEMQRTFKDYFGIDTGSLTAYFLDPEKALPLLEKQVATANIGAEAAKQQMPISAALAGEIQTAGVTTAEAARGFATTAGQMGLATGYGDVTSQEELINANLLNSAQAAQNVSRVAQSRVNRFAGGGAFESDRTGNTGLGTATR